MDFKVTPWDVEGLVDYDKLIVEFGTTPLTNELLEKTKELTKSELPLYFRRKFFFSHRDYNLVLKDYEEGKGFFLYTGRGPSGPMHIGHIIPFFATKWLQEKFGVNLYVQITDDEKFLFKPKLTFEETKRWAYENILDIIAVGFDPDKTFIFQDSEFTKIYEMAIPIAKKVNYSMAKAVFGFTDQSKIGMIFYPAIQAAPTFFEKRRSLIPAAIDQDPYWRIQRDFAESLGYYKAAAIHSKFVPGLMGVEGKMSASKPETAIYLTDTPEEAGKKIWKYALTGGQPTLKEQREKGGNPDKCVVFKWLEIFFESDDKALIERYHACKGGELLCGQCKRYLIERVQNFLREHQKRREKAKEEIEKFKYTGELAQEQWNKSIPEALRD
ncbi:tryptophanyl-tRNA synthetase [Palaeococcus pacificus DY20341]|uniref:Tryptophan--tRNA ligase n=1 Tax=Palaeococcus pacificus DY20341 TaxID=1343739 RepID=A0A075LRB3_9EURY|nr:tryptophan--tRNA ligase [Palaeococcus pacificus]AIF68517.1 tryptophanyl-tRNA synthetase [Palaeococcus pacificus DY20341]